jgi:catechol 2,3-dioxygenase-like lactoylglutathione lyase family enzyme
MPDQAAFAAVVYARDLARVSDFYAAVLGSPGDRGEPGQVVFDVPAFQLVVLEIPEPIASKIRITSPPERRTQTPIKLAFPVGSIAALRAIAAGLGGQVDAAEHEWLFRGSLVCDGYDPEGNVVQLREPVR